MAVYAASIGPKYELLLKWLGTGKRILDVGCGAGAFSARLAKHNDVTGVEISEENYKLANQQMPVYFGDFLTIEIREHFDVVMFADILEHLYEPKRAIQKAARLADEVIICVPNASFFVIPILKSLGIREMDTGILDRTHVYPFTRASAEHMIRDCGLTIVDNGSPRPRRAPAFYQSFIDRWPNRFALQFMYRCRVNNPVLKS